MKRITALFLLCVFTVPLLFQDVVLAASQEKQKYSLAVLNFVAPPLTRTDARVVTEQLVRELRSTGLFYTMSQSNTERGLLEANIDGSNCGDMACAIRAGKALGVQLVVMGTIRQQASAYSVDVQMVHVGSRQIVKEFQDSSVPDLAGLYETMRYAAQEMVGKSGSRAPQVNSQPKSNPPQSSPQAGPERYSEPEPYYYEESGGGFKWGYVGVGLLVAGGVGAALLLSNGDSDDGGTSGPPSDTGDLPGPPSFP